MNTVKKFIKSRFGLAVVAFVVGGVITALLLPEIKFTKTEKVTEYVDREVVVEKEVVKEVIVEVEKEIVRKEKVIKHKETRPDGTIIETEIYESEEEQISRVRQEERDKFETLLASKENEWRDRQSELEAHINPKRLSIFAGYMPLKDVYLGGFNYALWGPLTIGVTATSKGTIAPTLGIRF